jgi:hypothetical protein
LGNYARRLTNYSISSKEEEVKVRLPCAKRRTKERNIKKKMNMKEQERRSDEGDSRRGFEEIKN